MQILQTLKKPTNFLYGLGVALLVFNASFYAMKNLPGVRNKTCVLGGNLTTQNIIFSIIFSSMLGIIISGLIELYQQKSKQQTKKIAGLAGVASVLSGGTMFCSICTVPILALTSASTALYFFVEHSIWIQISSVLLMAISLYFLDSQLADNCKLGCKV